MEGIKVTVYYDVKGLNYALGGYVVRKAPATDDVIQIVNAVTDKLKSDYKGYDVEITRAYVDSN